MWVLVSLFATAALTSGCKKKSECVRRVERYLACDEAKPNPERACREMPEEAKNEMERCDEIAKGDCEQFLICTGVKSKPHDATAPAPGGDGDGGAARTAPSPEPSAAGDASVD